MKAQAMVMPVKYFFDKDGNPLAYGKVYTYQAGTLIPKETYTTENGDIPNTNPVILNGEGYASIYLDGSYNIVVDDKDDNNIWTEDPVSSNTNNEWTNSLSVIYVSPDTVKVTGNYTNVYKEGITVRIDNGLPDFAYSTVKSSSFSGGETTIVLNDSVVDVGVVSISASLITKLIVNHNDTINRDAVDAHDSIYKRLTTTTEIATGVFNVVGTRLKVSDRADATFVITSGGIINGKNILDAGNGNTAVLEVGMVINPLHWGAVDGQDNSEVLKAISDTISSYTIIDLGNIEYVITASGVPSSPFGHRIFDLDNKDGIQFLGDRARVTVVDHDISTNGGLNFIWAKACNGLCVKGIDFVMSFIGVNTGSAQYPWCSAIVGNDGSNADEGGVRTQDQLNGNWNIEDNTFKMFHPYGQFAQSGSAYEGDPNNGFKVFPCFVNGPFDAVNYANQCRKITFDNCTLKEGGNSYGFWAWAWNDVSMINCTAESFVGKQSGPTGVFSGRGEPMLRYHQFYCEGLTVSDNYFRAKPCNERLTDGFEGDARFVDYNTNLLGNYGHGVCTITGNTIIGGRGDLANAMDDFYINLIAYGSISVTGNTFGSTPETTNANLSVGIFWNSEAVGGQGNACLSIIGNNWNAACDYMDNISIANGATTPANRRLKTLVIEGNTSLGQFQYFNKMGATNTAYGVQDCRIQNNNISGEFNTKFDKNSTNSRAIEVSGSESTDVLDVSRNTIRDKYYGIKTNGHSGRFVADYNEMIGVTTRWLGAIPIISERRDNAPSEAAANGSKYIRTNGVAGAADFTRIGGAWVAVG